MTIEKRAVKYAEEKVGYDITKPLEEQAALGVIIGKYKEEYIRIASEQEIISKQEWLDKACKWLDERCAFGVHPCSGFAVAKEFRKFMEE